MRAFFACARPAARRLFAGLPGVHAAGPDEPPDPAAEAWVAWGAVRLPPPPPGTRVLNRAEAVALLADRTGVRERLRLAGLEPAPLASTRGRPGWRAVRVALFDLRPYALEVLDPRSARWRPAEPDELGPRARERAAGAAIRALNALRLDAGRVTLGIGPPREREAVCRIELGPLPAGQAARSLRELLLAWLGEPVRVQPTVAPAVPPVRLGADPEFVLVDRRTGEVIPASRFLPRAGAVGCDGYAVAPGVHPVAELRPPPSADPRELVAAIRGCLLRAAARLPAGEVAWRAGCEPAPGLPTGGHIHFSGIPLSGALLRALDAYLAIPLALLEPAGPAARRRARHGFLGDVRPKQHGGFEYRTPASWLVSPRVAAGALALARLVAVGHRQLQHDPFLDAGLMRAFACGCKEPLAALLPALRRDVERLPGYARSAADVEPIFDMATAGSTWDEEADLRAAWGIAAATARAGTAPPRPAAVGAPA